MVGHRCHFIRIASVEGAVQFVSPSGQALVGLDGDTEVRTTRIPDYIFHQYMDRFRNQVWPSIMRDGEWEGEMRFRHFKTGAAIPILHKTFCIKEYGTARPLALATINRDITERKRTEDKLRLAQT